MASTRTETPRERYRARIRAEVKDHAWEQNATAGASGLSLNAIAKRMGMSGPALYRYFANRDELITELIKDAYRSLADTLHTAADSGADLTGLAHAMRGWALADPHRHFLLYGTPIPGYHAPDATTAISAEIMAVLLDACTETPVPAASDHPGTPFAEHLRDHRHWARGHAAPPETLHRALTVWTRLHGLLSLELAGHFNGMGFDPELLFASELEALGAP